MENRKTKSVYFAVIFISLAATLACGPLEFLFTNIPQRYIESNAVKNADLIGVWEITSESASRVEFLDKSKYGVSTPWKKFSLNENGTCHVEIPLSWLSTNQMLLGDDAAQSSCIWQIKNILGYEVDGTFKKVPGVVMAFSQYNSLQDSFSWYFGELFIVHENSEFVLWNFIGNPDLSHYQDYQKVKP